MSHLTGTAPTSNARCLGQSAAGTVPEQAQWYMRMTKQPQWIVSLIDCYSLDRTLEIHGAANTKQIQVQEEIAQIGPPPS